MRNKSCSCTTCIVYVNLFKDRFFYVGFLFRKADAKVKTFKYIFKEGRKEGRKEGYREALVSIVIKKLQKGMSAEEIADFLEEDVLTIQRIYDIANTYAPEYDIEKIVQKLENTSGMKQK